MRIVPCYVLAILGYALGMTVTLLGEVLAGLLVLFIAAIAMSALLYRESHADCAQQRPDRDHQAPIHL